MSDMSMKIALNKSIINDPMILFGLSVHFHKISGFSYLLFSYGPFVKKKRIQTDPDPKRCITRRVGVKKPNNSTNL